MRARILDPHSMVESLVRAENCHLLRDGFLAFS
jgi:hypothetical protein